MKILFETEGLLVIDKPADLVVEHSHNFASVEEQVMKYLSKTKKKPFAGIVHRLDRPVSGALLVAKKKSILKLLNEQFSQKKVHKTYLAIVSNPPPAKSGELKNWLKKDPTNKKAEVVKGPQKEAAECKLFYRTLASKGQFILLEIVPHTGKFHQIRAQLSAAGCPILGDAKYGAQTAYLPESIALHAWKLDFKNPENADSVHIVATPPGNKFWNPFLEHF